MQGRKHGRVIFLFPFYIGETEINTGAKRGSVAFSAAIVIDPVTNLAVLCELRCCRRLRMVDVRPVG